MSHLTKNQKEILLNQLKVEWTYSSNSIEGSSLTLGETKFIIDYGLTIQGKSIKEHNEVLSHVRAIDLIYKLKDKDKLEVCDIFMLHKAILTDVVIDIYSPVGEWKNESNGRFLIVDEKSIYLPYPSQKDIPYLMNMWLEYFNDNLKITSIENAIKIYTTLHLSFTSIHPFFDGNGRLARLLSNLVFIKNEFLPLIISATDRFEYIQVLSNYDIHSNILDSNSVDLVVKNSYFEAILDFFTKQYENSKELLNQIVQKEQY
ncbi:MAG: Fic family protein [Campylobacterales bacterium]|nr:Fic family protein [Campylobacterales bacterium]